MGETESLTGCLRCPWPDREPLASGLESLPDRHVGAHRHPASCLQAQSLLALAVGEGVDDRAEIRQRLLGSVGEVEGGTERVRSLHTQPRVLKLLRCPPELVDRDLELARAQRSTAQLVAKDRFELRLRRLIECSLQVRD